MAEIRAQHLRFTPDEAQRFLTQAMKLDLDAETIRTVEARTEGWAAGLQLAGLALQNLPNPRAFVASFGGSHRYVLDYLAEEVIRQLGAETRQFLTQTSVLARFNAAACEALTGRTDSQARLQALDQANLFVVPLDDERIWYRYHHLFADYLRTLLTKAETIALCKRASAWCEANDLTAEAVQYALTCADADFAADVVARALHRNITWSGGNVAMLLAWLDALAPQVFASRPQLSLDASRILYLANRFDRAEECIDQSEQSLNSQPATPETVEMLALAALYRGAIAAVRGDGEQAIAQITYAQARLPRDHHLAHARGFFSLGLAYALADQTALAVQNYLQSSAEAEAAGVLFLAIHARCAAAQVQISQGQLHLAEATCQAAIHLAGGARLAPLGLAWVIRGAIALERNDLASAERFLSDGIALSRQGGLTDDVILGLAHLARLRVVQGDTPGALAAVHELTSISQAYGAPRISMLAAAHLARLHLYMGERQAAAQWATEYQVSRTAATHEYEELTLARVLLATGDVDAMPSILQPLLEKADAAGRRQTVIEASLLRTLHHHARKDDESALVWLGQALRLAAPEGYARLFLDEGGLLLDLLPKVRAVAPDYVDNLLDAIQPPGAPRPSPLAQLPEPLSEQEVRVLHLIVAGKSNREIAEELVITVGTAKWHVHNVLQKLGVSNRPQAIARAHKLGIG
ncbi:MAG: LuxR C-terminal-related transcriptional regulator [Caldilinea sp.]